MTNHIVKERNHLYAFVNGLIFTSAALLCITFFFILGPIIETKYFPAIDNIQITIADGPDPKKLYLGITGDVKRACTFVDIGGLSKVNGTFVPADVQAIDMPKSMITPLGHQNFGRLQIDPKGDEIVVELVDDCHPGWLTRSIYHYP